MRLSTAQRAWLERSTTTCTSCTYATTWSIWTNTTVNTSATIRIDEDWGLTTATTSSTPAWAVWTILQNEVEQTREEVWWNKWVLAWAGIAGQYKRDVLEAERKAATKRARKLLLEVLTEEQRRTYEASKYFDVEVNEHRYRVTHGSHGNIKELDKNGKVLRGFCSFMTGECPTEDGLLGQLLMLRTDEARFLATANVLPN